MGERADRELSFGGIFVHGIGAQTSKNGRKWKCRKSSILRTDLHLFDYIIQKLIFKLSETYRLLGVHGAPSSLKNQRTKALIFPLFALGK